MAHYAGLTVVQMQKLRREMKAAGASVKVAKNRLAKIALEGTDVASIGTLLTGPTVLAYSKDPVAAPKVAVDFAKGNDKLVILGGAMGKTALNADGVKALAAMPSLDELRAKTAGPSRGARHEARPAADRARSQARPRLRRLCQERTKRREAVLPSSFGPYRTEPIKEPAMADLTKIVDELSSLTILEAAELAKLLEEKWGVSAAAAVAVAAAPGAGAAAAAPVEEQTEFTVMLAAFGDKKIEVIKEVRAVTGLGLKEAKDLVEAAPKPVKEGVSKERGQQDQGAARKRAGAKVELK